MKNWPKVRLEEVLKRSLEMTTLQPDIEYREVTVRLWGKGVVERGRVLGAEIASGRRFTARPGQFIVSRIDARNGAMGIVPEALDRAVVTNDFPLFNLNTDRILPSYFNWLSHTKSFVELCQRASEGTTNRVRLQEERFLALELPLPPLAEQRQIVARIDELTIQINEASFLRKRTTVQVEALFAAKIRATILECGSKVRYLQFTEVARLERRPISIEFNKNYQEIGVYCFGRGIFHKPPRTGAEVGTKDLYEVRSGDFILQITFAWEGAVALANTCDDGLFGSVRYLTFRVNEEICSPRYLLTYMKAPEVIAELSKISPGSAGRNRVLSVKRLDEIIIPIVPLSSQVWLTKELEGEVDMLKCLQDKTAAEFDALLPAILDRAFKGELL